MPPRPPTNNLTMQTKLVRINLANLPEATETNPSPLETAIHNASREQRNAGLRLISTFMLETHLILIFQD
jgi:hypothetical protein